MKYKDFLDLWVENYVKPSCKVRTYDRYKQLIDLRISPDIGEMETENLSPVILQTFITDLLTGKNAENRKGLSANTVNLIISVMRNSLRLASVLGYSKEYFANAVKRPKLTERKIECFSFKEQKQIEAAALNNKKQKFFGIILCLYTGLRIGELIALKWQDIDLKQGLLTVSRSCHDASGGIVFDEPKTANSRRVIPLPRTILPQLRTLKRNGNSDFVISENGKCVSVRSYQRSFELLLKKLKIVHHGFHALRHTFATRALECGMDVKTLSEILGHKNPTVTLNRYAHSLSEHKITMMNRLGKLFKTVMSDKKQYQEYY